MVKYMTTDMRSTYELETSDIGSRVIKNDVENLILTDRTTYVEYEDEYSRISSTTFCFDNEESIRIVDFKDLRKEENK